ncbi:MFS transporter [Lentzea sp. NPDC006480]|uniref:MFS transporter n=1 Tax=Lentzea sp. NPDC006480 TaxID=3157176 RepID=UPI0033BAA681
MARLLTPRFALLTAADLGYFTAMGIAVYTLPLYVTGPLHNSKAAAGLAFGSFAVSALLLRPFAGRLTDRLGRRPLLVGGTVLAATSLSLTSLAHDLPSVISLRLLLGVGEAAFFVAGFAALVDIAPPDRLGEALSLNSLGLYLGLAAGPPLGEVLTQLSFPAAWLAAGALCVTAAVASLFLGETGTPATGPNTKLIHRPAIPPGIGLCTALAACGGFLAFSALRAQQIGLENTSLPLFLYGATVVAARLVFAKVPDRVPPLKLGAIALAIIATALVLAAVPDMLLVGSVVLGLGVTFSTPAFFAAVFATAAPHQRGAASGTASAFIDIGLGGGPILLGLVANIEDIPLALATGGVLAAAGCLWTLWIDRPH